VGPSEGCDINDWGSKGRKLNKEYIYLTRRGTHTVVTNGKYNLMKARKALRKKGTNGLSKAGESCLLPRYTMCTGRNAEVGTLFREGETKRADSTGQERRLRQDKKLSQKNKNKE